MWNDRYLNPCSIYGRAAFEPLTATMAIASLAGSAISAAGTIAGGNAAADAGQAQAAAQRQGAADNATALEFKAKQEDMAAQESRAAAQRVALDKQHQGKLVLSTLQARAASGGGGASDPGVLNLASQIEGRSEYDALTSMYTGENHARGLMDIAAGDRYAAATGITGGNMAADAAIRAGEARRNASYLSAAGTIVGGAGSAYRQYGGFGSPASPIMVGTTMMPRVGRSSDFGYG